MIPHVYGIKDPSRTFLLTAGKIAREVAAPAAFEVDKNGRFPSESMAALAKEGFYGLTIPREFGGQGEGARTFCAVVEELSTACASTAMIYIMHVVATQAISNSPALQNKAALLKEIAAGKLLCTLAYSEAGSRSNFWVQVSELKQEGADCSLTSLKGWVTAAAHSNLFVVAARRPGAASGIDTTVFLIRKDATVHVKGGFDGLGLRGNESSPVEFKATRIPAADLITAQGEGTAYSLTVITPWFNIGTSAMAHGLCRAAVDTTANHLKTTPLEFNKSLLRDLPTLRARLAEMAVRTEQSRALLGHTLDHMENPSDAAGLYLLSSRHSAINAAADVTDLAMKACGGAAFRKELGLERVFRDARAGWVMAPTSDALSDFIGKALTGMELL